MSHSNDCGFEFNTQAVGDYRQTTATAVATVLSDKARNTFLNIFDIL